MWIGCYWLLLDIGYFPYSFKLHEQKWQKCMEIMERSMAAQKYRHSSHKVLLYLEVAITGN